MKTKSEIIATIDITKTYIGSFVVQKIKEVDCDDTHLPTVLKKGDVIKLESGIKVRPCVIIKVYKDFVIAIPLTSTENIHNLCVSSSRFFGEGWFSNTYVIVPIGLALERFIGVYDDMKVLNNAIKELKIFIEKNL